jgi:DNA helicase-2/ATP-dependent DNA helicase PcrA
MSKGHVVLDSAQQAAVDDDADIVVVRASAGSGKTEVLAQRVERIVAADAAGGRRVLCLSYTNRAAGELRERFADRLGDRGELVETSTVHAFAHDVVRRHGTWLGLPLEPEVLVNDADRLVMLSEVVVDVAWDAGGSDGRDLLQRVDLARARCETDDLVDIWRAAMASRGLIDFQGLIDAAAELLALDAVGRQIRRPYESVFIDEAHNLTPSQDGLLRLLAGEPGGDGPKLTLVGEPDQALVDFAGGDGHLMLRLAKDHDSVVHILSINYRSATKLVALAAAVKVDLDASSTSRDISYGAEGAIELRECTDEDREAETVVEWVLSLVKYGAPREALAEGEDSSVKLSDIAVLARSGTALRRVRGALDAENIQVTHAVAMEDWMGSTQGRVTLAVIGWRGGAEVAGARWLSQELELGDGPRDPDDLSRALHNQVPWLSEVAMDERPGALFDLLGGDNYPNASEDSGQWEADRLELAAVWERYAARVPLRDRSWQSLQIFLSRMPRDSAGGDALRVGTIHSAQGREFKAVAVVGLNDGQLPDFRARSDNDRAAELRAFYVAVSRPTRLLLLTRAQSRETRYGSRGSERSPFMSYADPLVS